MKKIKRCTFLPFIFIISIFILVLCSNQLFSKDGNEDWECLLSQIKSQTGKYNSIKSIQVHIPKGQINASSLVEWIKNGFREYPPGSNANRDILFFGLDVASVVSEKNNFSPLYDLRVESTRHIYDKLKNAVPTDKLIIYKLYNEGTIICAPGVCFGVDIVLDIRNNDLAPGFAKIFDGLFITHSDGDHYDTKSRLIPELEQAGKPIILPKNNKNVSFGKLLTSGKLQSLEWFAFRGGHVFLKFSSFYCFKIADKWNILHSGDNCVWLAFAESDYAKNVDIFFLKPEAIYLKEENPKDYFRKGNWKVQQAMKEILRKIKPKIVIPHHLLELGHGLGAYGHDMGFRLRRQVPEEVKVQMLQWGESLELE